MEIIFYLVIVVLVIWWIGKKLINGVANTATFLLTGRTYSKSDCEQILRDAKHELRKGKITEEEFLDIEYEIKKVHPDVKNY